MISENDMKNFFDELFSAITTRGIKQSEYVKLKRVDEKECLERISVKHNIRMCAYKLDEAICIDLLNDKGLAELETELVCVKDYFMYILNKYARYDCEELKDFSNIELLEMVKLCIDEDII